MGNRFFIDDNDEVKEELLKPKNVLIKKVTDYKIQNPKAQVYKSEKHFPDLYFQFFVLKGIFFDQMCEYGHTVYYFYKNDIFSTRD